MKQKNHSLENLKNYKELSYETVRSYLVNETQKIVSKRYIGIKSHHEAMREESASLGEVASVYGENVSLIQIKMWLISLNEWVNVADHKKLSKDHIDELASFIYTDFKEMKMSEFAYCMSLIKKGVYGEFYGSISPTMILSSFRKYMDDREKMPKFNFPNGVRKASEGEIRHCLGDEYTYNENVEKLGIEYIWLEKVKQCLMIRTDRDKPYFVYNSKIYEL